MELHNKEVDDVLEQTLLQSYDKEAVAKLLDKGMKRAVAVSQWDQENEVSTAKRTRTSDENKSTEGLFDENHYLESKIEMLEAQLKTEKERRMHFEEKSFKQAKNLKKVEEVVSSQKIQLRAVKNQPSSIKIEQMKAKMLIRIGDIEKDTIETKAVVAAELRNIADIKKPLENVSKLVEFLKTELETRDKQIEEGETLLIEREKNILEIESKLGEMSSSLPDIQTSKSSPAVNECSEEKVKNDFVYFKFKEEENLVTIADLTHDIDKLEKKNKKLKDKKEVLGEDYDELERYLTKTEMKLEKKELKFERLSSEIESSHVEIESLTELNENLLEQMKVLKEETVLLKDTITQKESKLSRVELKLRLSKEDLKSEVLDSYKTKEGLRKKEATSFRNDLEAANLKINNLLQSKHKLEIDVENLKLEIYTLVRSQKAEMKKLKNAHDASTQQMFKTIKLLRIQLDAERLEDENNNFETDKSSNLVKDDIEKVNDQENNKKSDSVLKDMNVNSGTDPKQSVEMSDGIMGRCVSDIVINELVDDVVDR